jgi:ATP adenylyltransferase
MLKTLIRAGGRATITDIAKAILAYDQSQIEYYEEITKNMVGRVLTKNGVVTKEGGSFTLRTDTPLIERQAEELTELCESELHGFLAKRGETLYDHRRSAAGYIPGTIRYEVLKAAGFRCMLCGISADECFLDVDHIEPKSKKGKDDINNYQALCYRCNRSKGNRDSTDLRQIPESYEHRMVDCVFCSINSGQAFLENRLAYAIWDKFPVTRHHALIIPRRHQATYFDLSRSELNACDQLIHEARARVLEIDQEVSGFNIGVNAGETAGQTILHCHLHLIPRRKGDVEDPGGGIRHLIPAKGYYPAT